MGTRRRSWYCLLASGRALRNIFPQRTEILEIPSVRHQVGTVSRPIPTGYRWFRASMRRSITSEEVQGMPSPMTSTVNLPFLPPTTLALSAEAPDTLPGVTLVSQALAEIPATRMTETTAVSSPVFASAILAAPASLLAIMASPEAAVETQAIHLDRSAAPAATVSSMHPTTRTLASAPAVRITVLVPLCVSLSVRTNVV